MGRFRDWLREEMTAALRPDLEAVGEQAQRGLHDTSKRLQEAIVRELDQTRHQMLEQRVEVGDRTRAITDALDQIRAQLDSDRAAQRAELQAVLTLHSTLRDMIMAIAPKSTSRPSIRGGWIDPALVSDENTQRAEIDLTDRIQLGDLVDARSRFGETWFEGLEVSEIAHEAHGERYRLTRQSDGRTLPMLFDAVDLRPMAAELENTSRSSSD